jgi:hypothetical protein
MREFKFFRGIISPRKIRVTWSPEMEQDLQSHHGIDVESELASLLSEEIAREVDNEILRNLTGTLPFLLTGSGTITTNDGYALTTTNTGTANYNTLTATNIANYTTTASDNLHYLNHFINLGGGNRA